MLYLLLILIIFFFNDTATTEIYTLSLHDALPIFVPREQQLRQDVAALSEIGRFTPPPDLRDQRRMERVPGPDEPRPRGVRPEPAIARGKEHERIPAEAGDREDVTAQLVTTCAGLDTEDD